MHMLQARTITVSPDGVLVSVVAGVEPQRLMQVGPPDSFLPIDPTVGGCERGTCGIHFELDGGHAIRIVTPAMDFERVTSLYEPQLLTFASALALLSSVGVFTGFVFRIGRYLPASGAQRIAGRGQLAVSTLWLVAAAGIALSYLWYRLIRSYRDLNTAKFKVIHEIEKRLPLSPYDAEWEAMGRGNNPMLYKPFTHIETGVPWVFVVLHALVLLHSIPWKALRICL